MNVAAPTSLAAATFSQAKAMLTNWRKVARDDACELIKLILATGFSIKSAVFNGYALEN
jgi:hypothetical protein